MVVRALMEPRLRSLLLAALVEVVAVFWILRSLHISSEQLKVTLSPHLLLAVQAQLPHQERVGPKATLQHSHLVLEPSRFPLMAAAVAVLASTTLDQVEVVGLD